SGNPVPGLPPVAFSPDSQTVASYASDGSVQLWSLADGTLAFLAQSPSQGSKILVASRDATRLAAVAGDGKQVQVWDTAGHALLTTLQYGQFVTALAFSPDGQTLAAGLTPSLSSETGTSIVILRIADGTAVGSPFVGPTGYVVAVAYSPDGAGLAPGSSDSTLRFWRVAGGGPVHGHPRRHGHGDACRAFLLHRQERGGGMLRRRRHHERRQRVYGDLPPDGPRRVGALSPRCGRRRAPGDRDRHDDESRPGPRVRLDHQVLLVDRRQRRWGSGPARRPCGSRARGEHGRYRLDHVDDPRWHRGRHVLPRRQRGCRGPHPRDERD